MNTEEIATKNDLIEMERRILQAISEKTEKDRNLTIDQAVEYICAKNRGTIYKLTHSGELAYQKVGKANVFRKSDLDKYLARHRRSSTDELSAAAALRSV